MHPVKSENFIKWTGEDQIVINCLRIPEKDFDATDNDENDNDGENDKLDRDAINTVN